MRYRSYTYDDIIEDIINLIRVDITLSAKKHLFRQLLWYWTEKKDSEKSFISEDAQNSKRTIKEHVVPRNVIISMFFKLELNKPDKRILRKSCKSIMEQYCIMCEVSLADDYRLTKAGYRSKMPAEFYDVSSPLYNNIWSRYIITNIEVIK